MQSTVCASLIYEPVLDKDLVEKNSFSGQPSLMRTVCEVRDDIRSWRVAWLERTRL